MPVGNSVATRSRIGWALDTFDVTTSAFSVTSVSFLIIVTFFTSVNLKILLTKTKKMLLVRFESRTTGSKITYLIVFKHFNNIIIIIAIGISSFFAIATGETILVNDIG